TFFLGAFLAGLGGVAYCTKYGQVDPLTGFMPGLKAFIAAVLGGIGSIPGAVVGGLFLGVSENLFAAYVSTEWKDALAFLLLVLAGVAGLAVGVPCLRLRGDYLAIATLAFGEIVRIVIQNTPALGGSLELSVRRLVFAPQGLDEVGTFRAIFLGVGAVLLALT